MVKPKMKPKEPKRRTVEMEINVGGKKKRIVATNCTIKAPLLSKLGFGKKREVLACESVDIIEPEEESRPFESGEEISVEKDDEPEPSFVPLEERAKARPRSPPPVLPRRDDPAMPEP